MIDRLLVGRSDTGAQQKTAFAAGLGQGFSLFTVFFLYYCGFAGGAYLMKHEGYSFKDVLQVMMRMPLFAVVEGGREFDKDVEQVQLNS